jgi:glutamate synthase (NADPH) large chain
MQPEPGYPVKQGLYNPQFEHDACGIGFVVHVKGEKSHAIIRQAITILVNLAHRGGAGSERTTGDGAGILIQLPDKFFRQVCPNIGIELPPAGSYGVGMVFLPRDEKIRRGCEQQIEAVVRAEGQMVLGWRTLPVNDAQLGETARASRPHISQLFIGRSADLADSGDLPFERRLFMIRKQCEKLTGQLAESSSNYFYIASLSCRTIVFKGMLTANQVDAFYIDLTSLDTESALALVHSRYSTNTFPSWERAHPYRYLIHNGEINTLRGNINWMNARQGNLASDLFGDDPTRIFPIINPNGSDSAMFDNCLEFLALAGRSLPHAAMMMVPEPWHQHESMSDELKAFYEYHSTLMEPWDGPAAMAFTDGVQVGAILDRNGLRPSRYTVTKDGLVILASETGVLDIAPENVLRKDRLRPGRMLLIDTAAGRIIANDELKAKIAAEYPYRQWLDRNIISLADLMAAEGIGKTSSLLLEQLEKAFGYTYEDLRTIILPMARDGIEPLGSMGTDTPLAVLSAKPQLLYNYFKQMFAQVTNPPIDALREEIVIATETTIGSNGSLTAAKPSDNPQIRLKVPVISNRELSMLKQVNLPGLKAATLPILYAVREDGPGLEQAMDNLFAAADQAIASGANILILSDRDVDADMAPIPALLAVSGLHQHLVRTCTRTRTSLILESGEPREVHHFALLIGFGVSAINPWLAFDAIDSLWQQSMIHPLSLAEATEHYIKAAVKGIVKILSKMGISTIQSYRGAQIFEALGIHPSVIDRYFTETISRIGGIDLKIIAEEAHLRHLKAFDLQQADQGLESGGQYQWRSKGEYHLYNPLSVHKLQQAVRQGNYQLFKEYSRLMNEETLQLCTLRGLLELRPAGKAVLLEEVEPVESIVKRFKTGAMSYGSISQEAHETMAIAMNRLGGRSNTGEGGEDPRRFSTLESGDSLSSAIKQVASGRFGVTSEYLVNAREIQIKMAQGAKPGEGGQLPGCKVYPWIARTRHSTAGVGLISPPPHHDIYSIEDLAELIHDLKNANNQARISVKLVSEAGVGTIAAGVAKGRADVVLISGYDGGTGASPLSSIRHAGLPWELGVAETHQTLMLNHLRGRIAIETDGKLLTGRDVVVAALLGAEEFGFATGPLVAMGCVMMRACDRDTCPVGVATQNPELRKRFAGKPEHVENFMCFIAAEMREWMASLGFRTVNEMIGRTDCLEQKRSVDHWKASSVDLSALLARPPVDPSGSRFCQTRQDHGLADSLDERVLLPVCRAALLQGLPIQATLPIRNVNRVTATRLGSEITRRHGAIGLPDETILLKFVGAAGQSFGAFIPHGLTLVVEGEANDYIGKGLSGGKIIVRPDPRSGFKPEENIIIGNVAFYGATSGEAFIRGAAGERFCVRNSGMSAVVEAVGDHGCEYMTGGRVVVLGPAGRNFAAGMSGGIAYVLDTDGTFIDRCNTGMADPVPLDDPDEIEEVRELIQKHIQWTGSTYAAEILANWPDNLPRFWKIMPREYKRMQEAFLTVQKQGLHGEEALLAAFESSFAAANGYSPANGD